MPFLMGPIVMSRVRKSSRAVASPGDKPPAVQTIEDIRFRKLIENSHEGLRLLDKDLRVIYQSASAERINGWSIKHNGFYAIDSLVHPDDLEEFKTLLGEVLTSPGISKQCVFRSRCFDGHYIWLESLFTNFLHDPDINAIVCNFRDITERKNDELQKSLLSSINQIFNETPELNDALYKILELLVDFGNFCVAGFWLIGTDKRRINNTVQFSKTAKTKAFIESTEIKSFSKGDGVIGIAWETRKTVQWNLTDQSKNFKRLEIAKKAGLTGGYAIPLIYNEEVVGVLEIDFDAMPTRLYITLFENLSSHLGSEIKRKHQEYELTQIFNFAPDIICIAGADGYFKKINPAMCTLLEYTEEELLTRPYIEFVYGDDKGTTANVVEDIFDGQISSHFENRYITKSGKIKTLAWATTNVSEDGLLFCVAKDITDTKELEELLNKAVTLARIGSWEVMLHKWTFYWSDMTRDIHETKPGYTPDLEAATNFYKEGESRETIVKTMENAAINGIPGDVELQIVTAKGNVKWVRVIVEAEFSDGKCLRLYGSIQDIDAKKRAELASKEALEERNTILESIDDAFFAVDKNWIVTYWNNMAQKVLQTPKDKILNKQLWEVFSDSIDSESYKKYHQAVETNRAVHFEDHYQTLSKWYEISAYPSDSGLSVYFKDISDRKLSETILKELNANLQKQAKELAISNAELEQFAYVASHDLQEPLRMVTSFLTQLEKKYSDIIDEKGRQYIHFAVDGAKRMRQIILDLLDFSRVGTSEDDLEQVDFNKLIDEILTLYRRQIDEQHAEVVLGHLPTIKTYKTPIRQVFQNLVSNSLKYHRKGVSPIIHINCKQTDTHFQFSVRDNGIGILPEYFDKIFIIFQRLHNKNEYSGTGMGLAIAKKIVENFGGKIWVESEEGKGSTFYFTMLKK